VSPLLASRRQKMTKHISVDELFTGARDETVQMRVRRSVTTE
jgi:hypothetical protein